MKYVSEKFRDTSVHSWKPVTPEKYVALLHRYSTECCDEHGNSNPMFDAVKLDRDTTAVIVHARFGGYESAVGSPVLMSVTYGNGRIIQFASLKFGHEADPDLKIEKPRRQRAEDYALTADKFA